MKRKISLFSVWLISLGLLFITSAGGTTAGPVAGKAAPAKETWQQAWSKCLAAAKKEGKVVIASSIGPDVRKAITRAVADKYGIEVEFMQGKPAQLVPKVQTERRAGLFTVDLFIGGVGGIDSVLAQEGVLERLEPALILPEVVDKKLWWGGDLRWVDPSHLHLMFLAFVQHQIVVNTNLVKSDEIKSYRDLLSPKWKGKILWLDPTMAGGGRSLFMALSESLMDMKYLRELGKQEILITRDGRLLVEWVARGKYPIAVGIQPAELTEFVRKGTPIRLNPVSEGTYITGATGGIALLNKAPHPNGAKLFANWLLTREGQILASKAFGVQSAREDVPTDFLDPVVVRQPGMKYYNTMTVGFEEKRDEYLKIAREVWGQLLK